jgi:oligoribonuclease NrnB/cAMP/cGMP phosphodiesterase (DHH superfamily)
MYFFDNDPDGLSSFLLFYRKIREGQGVVAKGGPVLKRMFAKRVIDYLPDHIFVFDKPVVEQEFIDQSKTTITWIDHHEPVKRRGVKYYNPRIADEKDNRPTSYWAYQVIKQDIWIAMTGCIGDWFIPEFASTFAKKYPGYFNTDIKNPDDALFNTKIGQMSRIFSFILKGKTSEAMKCARILTRIKHPDEILEQKTSGGNFIYKRFEKMNNRYQELIRQVKVKSDKILLFTYTDDKMSFTSDLSNELLHKHPSKVVVIGREKSREMKCSLRSKNISLPDKINKALEGLEGYGGGHEFACGTVVNKDHFNKFLERLKEQL